MRAGEGQRGGRHRIQSRLQALSHQHRAICGAGTHEWRDGDLSWSRTLNWLSHSGAPTLCFLLRLYRFTSYIQIFGLFWANFGIWCEVGIQLYSFACGDPVVPAPFVEETVLSLLNKCLAPLSTVTWPSMCGFISGLCSIPLFHMHFSLGQYYAVLVTIALYRHMSFYCALQILCVLFCFCFTNWRFVATLRQVNLLAPFSQ